MVSFTEVFGRSFRVGACPLPLTIETKVLHLSLFTVHPLDFVRFASTYKPSSFFRSIPIIIPHTLRLAYNTKDVMQSVIAI